VSPFNIDLATGLRRLKCYIFVTAPDNDLLQLPDYGSSQRMRRQWHITRPLRLRGWIGEGLADVQAKPPLNASMRGQAMCRRGRLATSHGAEVR
jgi:hypothetical protein